MENNKLIFILHKSLKIENIYKRKAYIPFSEADKMLILHFSFLTIII